MILACEYRIFANRSSKSWDIFTTQEDMNSTMHSRGPFEFVEKQNNCYNGLVDEVYVLPRTRKRLYRSAFSFSAIWTLINSKVRVPLP